MHTADTFGSAAIEAVLRRHAEQQFAEELAALAEEDDRPKPPNWILSPWAVCTYLLGGTLPNGCSISAKYIGNARLIQGAVATLATDRALLLYGIPGTAKSWVSEHLAAAVSGQSTLIIQGTAGTEENAIRYGWNYARLLTEGPSPAALVVSPNDAGHATGQDLPHRGAHPYLARGPGYADHHSLREDSADPGAEYRDAGAEGLQRRRYCQ